jgi:hypothetical protein
MTPHACAVPIVVAALALAACGGSGSHGAKTNADATHAVNVRVVKLGMTKMRVRQLLGRADEVNELYGLPDLWVDWLYELDNGKAAVTFSKRGKVTRVMNCPEGVCIVIADSTRP